MLDTSSLLTSTVIAVIISVALVYAQTVFNNTSYVSYKCARGIARLSLFIYPLLMLFLVVELANVIFATEWLMVLMSPIHIAIALVAIVLLLLFLLQHAIPSKNAANAKARTLAILKKAQKMVAGPGDPDPKEVAEVANDLFDLLNKVLSDPDLDLGAAKKADPDQYEELVGGLPDLLSIVIKHFETIIAKPDSSDELKEEARKAIAKLKEAQEKWKTVQDEQPEGPNGE